MSYNTNNHCLRFLTILLVVISTAVHGQDFKWAINAGSPQADWGNSIKVDASGNIYMMGAFGGTISFDSAGFSKTIPTTGGRDLFLVKYNCKRVYQWAVKMGSTSSDAGSFNNMRIDLDANGNIYASGTFVSTAIFTSTNNTSVSKISNGAEDVFFAKYNTTGVIQWIVTAGGSGTDESGGVKVDASGNSYFTGIFSTTCTVNTTSGPASTLTSAGNQDIYLIKYNTNGVLQWATRAGGTAQDIGVSIDLSNTGDIYISGNFSFGGGNCSFGSNTITNAADWGSYIAKANSSGVWQWVNSMGTSASEAGARALVDNLGQVYLIGHFNGSTSISSQLPGSPVSINSNGNYDVYIAAFNTSGSIAWVKTLGSSGDDFGWNLAYNQTTNDLIAIGDFSSTTNFGPKQITSIGNTDIFVGWINRNNGSVNSITSAGGSGVERGFSIALAPDNKAIVCGLFQNNPSFNPYVLNTFGAEDAFIAKIGPENLIITSNKSAVCSGDSALLYTTNNAANSYQWFRNSAPIASSNNDSIYVKTAGAYRLVISNNCNEVDTSNTILISTGSINLINLSAFPNTPICVGATVLLQVVGTGATSYRWSPGKWLNDSTITNPIAKPDSTTYFKVTASNGGCSVTDSIRVDVIKVTANAGPDLYICKKDLVQVQASSSGGNSFSWLPIKTINNSTILKPTINPDTNTTYFLTVSNGVCTATDTMNVFVTSIDGTIYNADTAICAGDSIPIRCLINGDNYTWSPLTGLTGLPNPLAKPDTTVTYYLTVTRGTCIRKDSLNISVYKYLPTFAGNDTTICVGKSIQLSGTAPIGSGYSWQPNYAINNTGIKNPTVSPLKDTSYVLTTTLGNCRGYDTIAVKMDKSMAVNVGNDTMVCTGSPVPLKALAPAGSAFLWRPNYTLSNTTIYNPVATPAIDTFYWVEATLNGCSGYDTIYIRHHPQPQVNAGTDTFSCRNQPLSLTIGSSAWLADSFFWWPTSGISNPNSLQTQAIITPSEYVLTGVVKSTGCSAYDTLSLRSVVPKADFITDPSIVQAPQLVKCTNTSSANPAQPMSFIWQMGSPSEYFYTKDVQYTFTKEGKYDITLRAYINSGCYDSITKTIDVVGAFNIFIPNAFTPNGNGVNDVFEIKYTKDLLSEMRGSIWNRWGDKIYDFYMPGGSWWNGKVGSEYAQDEVYFYLLQVTTLTGKQLNFHGTVTLLR